MTHIASGSIGNFTSVSSGGGGPVTVEDLQDTAGVCGFHVVLVGRPDGLPVLGPADRDPRGARVGADQLERLAHREGGVLESPGKAHRF